MLGGGAELKAYASAGQTVLLLGVVPAFAWLSNRVDRVRLLTTVQVIFIGCLLAFALQHRGTFRVLARLGSPFGLGIAVALLLTAQALTHVVDVTAAGFRVASPLYYLPYSLAAALVICSLALQARGTGIFRSRPLRFVGRVSYPLYLTHPIALGFAATAIAPGGTPVELAYLALGLTVSLVLAWALHRVVERPLIAFGKRQARRIRGEAIAPAALATV